MSSGLEAFKTHTLIRRTPDLEDAGNKENVQPSQSDNSTPRGYVDREESHRSYSERVETSVHSREEEQIDKDGRLGEEDLDQLTYDDIYR